MVKKAASEKYLVSFKNVRFSYEQKSEDPKTALLKDITFIVKTGETVALVGASGCGKTTVARLLQRFWDVDGGAITINDTDVRDIELNSLRDLVTLVPQDLYLFNMSVSENLRLAKPEATESELKRACSCACADKFINRLSDGYETKIGERGFRLSGGEKQRLALAQAFLKDAPILILDEASANLDSQTERHVDKAIDQLKKDRAILIIAHRLSTIMKADRVVLIQGGKVEATGTFDQLRQTSAYFRNLIGAGNEL